MPDFVEYLRSLGNLHDCTVTRLELDSQAKTLTFDVEDIHWNFEGLPEYRGPLPGRIVLKEVETLLFDIEWTAQEKLRLVISEFTAAPATAGLTVAVRFWVPDGRIAASCAQATFPAITAE